MTGFNPAILEAAGTYIGTDEWPGARHNPTIQGFFAAVGHNPNEPDETPWCAAFVGAVLASLGLPNTGRLNARSYLDWGVPVAFSDARPGDVVILWRGDPRGWQGHVAFLVRFDGNDRMILRGGNQGNKVSDAGYPVSRLLGIRRAVAPDERGRPVLRHGARGPQVRALQEQLIELRYPVGAVDGVFGDRTRDAVLAFQADHNLDVDGIVGGRTWAALETGQPRPQRAVSGDDLRARGSRTMADADRAQALTVTGVAGGSLLAVSEGIESGARLLEQSSGALETALALVQAYWPVLAVIGFGLFLWHYLADIKRARVEDARAGRNIGR